MKKVTNWQLILFSTGGMVGGGWLFSPYYGFQTAGVGVIFSWVITALLTLIVGLSFAEVASSLPVKGGIMRFIGITHSRTLGFLFVTLGWVSYLVYLPLEAQSAIQYIGFWAPSFVAHDASGGVSLSHYGILLAIGIMLAITWFNTLSISKVSSANAWVSVWKIILPIGLAIGMLIVFAKPIIPTLESLPSISFEKVLLAITSSGLAFAFSGFQNGLFLANDAANPRKAIPLSLFAPVAIGLTMYSLLSAMFIFCLPNGVSLSAAAAPLLGLLALFNIHYIYTVLFIDAIIAPLGTANVFASSTGKILHNLAQSFLPNTIIAKLNKNNAPYIALWINMLLGILFLLPFPTWTQLVNFLSSLTLLSCLSGPLALIILRENFPDLERKFKLPCYKLTGYIGFICCGLFVYWSGTENLLNLVYLSLIVIAIYWLVFARNTPIAVIKHTWYLVAFLVALWGVSHGRATGVISFPMDNALVVIINLIACKIFLLNRDKVDSIEAKVKLLQVEIQSKE